MIHQSNDIVAFSEGGKDSVDNIAAVCPNCHRRLGLLKLPEDREILRRNIKMNEEKLDKQFRGKE